MGLPEDVNVIAWGLSLERPTMIKYGIDNIRDLVGHKVDLDMVQNNPLCRLDKSNDAVERQVDVANRRFDKILDKLDILQQRVNIAARQQQCVSVNNNQQQQQQWCDQEYCYPRACVTASLATPWPSCYLF